MRKAFEDVLLLCPEAKTGGPEAMHQLGHQIACHGGRARMVYYGPQSRIELDGPILRCHSDASPMPEHFAQYQPDVLREARLGPDTLLVFPEPMAKIAAARGVPYQRALWWLSLDNALVQTPELLDESFRQAFFADSALLHLFQSDYVRRHLQAWQAQLLHPLSDYTDPRFVHRSLAHGCTPVAQRARTVCFFPNKGAELAASFAAGQGAMRRAAQFVPIRDMTKAQVCDTLFGARVYIDFGHHPGKDRVPREAAIAGAVVLLHAAGAGACFGDHPLAQLYRFTTADAASGRLHALVDAILDDPDPHFAAQQAYRQAILLERERFDLEVRSLFFVGV